MFNQFLELTKKIEGRILFFLLILLAFNCKTTFSQTTYTFTTAGATGQFGPTQAQLNAAYLATNLNGSVTSVAGIQNFTVPSTGGYRIEAYGAQGGVSWGMGAYIAGDYTLTAGTILKIIVGQAGGTGNSSHGSGGGGSFIATSTNSALIVAGGGGGRGASSPALVAYSHGTTVTAGQSPPGGGPGGTGGGGGASASGTAGGTSVTAGGNASGSCWASGGGGFYTDGGLYVSNTLNGGRAFLNGGLGGDISTGCAPGSQGGFGGGGGCGDRGAGGGGFSGGGGGTNNADGGGGGGSYNGGVNQTNTSGINPGDGKVLITRLCNITATNVTVGGYFAICAGQSTTLTTNAVTYTWSNGAQNQPIVVSPGVTTSYTVTGTSTANCVTSNVITVTVTPSAPVLSVISSSNSVCLGQSILMTASGALTYTWTNGVTNGVAFTPSVTNTYTVSGQNGCGTTTAVVTVTVAPLAISAISSPTTICATSPATLTAVSPGTSYTWQPFGITGAIIAVNPSVTTVYTVTSSNGTCSGVTTLTLNVNPIPTISIVAGTSVICQGTSVNLTANGGLNYTWTPGNLTGNSVLVSPNTATLYTAIGSNSLGCTASANQVILVNASPTINILASTQLVCSGGSVNLTANGASNYTWLPTNTNGASISDNPVSSTTYTVLGTGLTNTCTGIQTINVNVFPTNVTVANSSSAICVGSSATLTGNGATSYQWSSGQPGNTAVNLVNPSSTSVYTLTANTTTGNLTCTDVLTIQVIVNPKPSVTAVASRTTICKNEASTLTASGASTYSWSNNTSSISAKVTPSVTTNYTVTGTDANGCVNTATLQVKVNQCTGISESMSNNSNGVNIYPNPSNGEFTVEANSDLTLSLINQLGQTVKFIKLSAHSNYKANITGLANGIYFIVGENGNDRINRKVIVSKQRFILIKKSQKKSLKTSVLRLFFFYRIYFPISLI